MLREEIPFCVFHGLKETEHDSSVDALKGRLYVVEVFDVQQACFLKSPSYYALYHYSLLPGHAWQAPEGVRGGGEGGKIIE